MKNNNMDLKDISFDESDKNLFQIDDLRLKADALKYSILPKLHVLTNQAILKIKEIYDIEVLEDSHIPQSPNFRTKRENDLKLDYKWAYVGITGKRTKKGTKEKWHGFKRQDGKPLHIVPFMYYFLLTENGLGIYLPYFYKTPRLSDDTYSKIHNFISQFQEFIHTLCYATGILPLDHIVPRSKGGKHDLDNYQTLCHICNIGKGNKDETDLRFLHS